MTELSIGRRIRRISGLLALAMALAGLAVADGHEQVVSLGTSGATVTLAAGDEGMYRVSGSEGVFSIETRVDGTPLAAIAENGNRYTLSMEEGEWMATFVAPPAIDVALGMSGESVAVQMQEDGSYMAGDMALMDAMGTVMASNGNAYELSMDEHGNWMAMYLASEQEVRLGITGQMITLVKAEDGTYWLGDMGIMDGSTVDAENGNVYALSMDADGMWMAAFQYPDPTSVALGSSGASVTFQRHEDGSYSLVSLSQVTGLTASADGGYTVTASNGNVYMLSMMDGVWTPDFQSPDPQMVMLGASGESVSIQKAEDGTYWLGAELLVDGQTTMSSDGRVYTLSLDDGMWMAAYHAPTTDVPLGTSGETASLVRAEDGTYWLGDALVTSGETTATTMDGYHYTLSMDEDGMWMATYMPVTQQVAVGNTGLSVTAVRDESGAWSFTNPLDGSNVPLADGMEYPVGEATYRASYADGMWTATYVAREVMVALGTSGETVTLTVAEDGTYWLGADLVVSGETMATSAVGVAYTLSMGEDGMWTAAPVGNQVMVTLGSSGMATLVLAEDGTWWHGSDQVADGSVIAAANGNMYRISMGEDGMWSATYEPAEMDVMGTGLVALANEAGDGYTIDGASLDVSGMGNITTSDGATYRVHMEDGMLRGARYDALRDDADHTLRLALADYAPTLLGNDRHTDADEAGTMLVLGTDDEEYPIGDLLGSGMASLSGDNIVADALEEVMKLRAQALAYHALEEQLDDETAHSTDIANLWNHATDTTAADAQSYVDQIFGFQDDGTTSLVALEAEADPDEVIDLLGQLITALSSADAFAAATKEDGDGILEDAMLTAAEAAKQFAQNKFESTAYLRTTENPLYGRYGLFIKQEREYVGEDLMFADAAGDENDMGEYDVFAYGLIPDTHTRTDLPARGSLHYRGGTLAVDPQADDGPVIYEGQIDIEVNLTRDMITGLVSALQDMDGNPFYLDFQEVASISLPAVTSIPAGLRWTQPGEAQVYYRLIPGATAAAATAESQFNGDLIGTGGQVAAAAIGVWRLGGDDADSAPVLLGSYGAQQIDVPDRPAPTLPGLTASEHADLPPAVEVTVRGETVTQSAEITDDGELKIVIAVPDGDATSADNDNPLAHDERSITHLVPIDDLNVGGQKAYRNGGTYVGSLLETIETQRKVINNWIELDATTDDDVIAGSARTGRRTAWATIRNALLTRIFGVATADNVDTDGNGVLDVGNVLNSMVDDYPGTTSNTEGTPDDNEANAFLDRLVAAFSSQDRLADEKEDNGIFDDDDDNARDSAWFNGATNAEVFGQQPQELVVGFGTTDYTRFGFWRLEKAASASHSNYDPALGTDATGDVDGPTGFAYSPLKPAAYISNPASPTETADRSFPSGTALYSGSTIAVQHTTRFHGAVQLSVTWNAAVASSEVQLAIRGLTDTNGLPPRNDTGRVRDITFTGITLAGWTDENDWVPQFETTGTASTVTYENLTSGTGPTGNLTGLFVGRGPDGPRAVVGTWTIPASGISRTHQNTGDAADTVYPMVGGYGAELGAP